MITGKGRPKHGALDGGTQIRRIEIADLWGWEGSQPSLDELVYQRSSRADQQEQRQGSHHRSLRITADGGHNQPGTQGHQQRIDQRQCRLPELPGGHSSQKERPGQHWQDGQQGEGPLHRRGQEFPRNNVITPQVGEKQEPDRTLAFFLTEAVGSEEQSGRNRSREKQPRQGGKERST